MRPERIPPRWAGPLLAGALTAWAGTASAYGPGATAGEAVAGSLGVVFGQGNFVALVLAGLGLGLLVAPSPGRTALVLAAGVAAGVAAGWAFGAPRQLDALIGGSGLLIAGLILWGGGREGPLAALPAALAIGLFALGLSATLRLDEAPPAYVATFVGTFAATVAAVVLAVFAVARRLRRAGGKPVRLVGIWAGVVAALLLALGLMPRASLLDGDTADLAVGEASLVEGELRAVVEALLARVYLAFEEESEEGIFDALAAVTDGDVLIELYLQRRQALVLEAGGGGRSELTALRLEEMTEAAPAAGPEHRVRAVWGVTGTYGHWGHEHERTNRYVADLTILPVDGTWRIGGFGLRDMVLVEPAAAP